MTRCTRCDTLLIHSCVGVRLELSFSRLCRRSAQSKRVNFVCFFVFFFVCCIIRLLFSFNGLCTVFFFLIIDTTKRIFIYSVLSSVSWCTHEGDGVDSNGSVEVARISVIGRVSRDASSFFSFFFYSAFVHDSMITTRGERAGKRERESCCSRARTPTFGERFVWLRCCLFFFSPFFPYLFSPVRHGCCGDGGKPHVFRVCSR